MLFSGAIQVVSQLAIALIFLMVALSVKRNSGRSHLWRVFYAFFIFDLALFIRTICLAFVGEYGASYSTAVGQLSNLVTDTFSIVLPYSS